MNSKIIVILTLVAFLTIGVLGLPRSLGMAPGESERMDGCLFHPQSSICGMTAFEHIETWRNMFNVILPIMALSILLFVFLISFPLISLIDNFLAIRQRYRLRSAKSPPPDPLQEALAQGLLNPKIFW